MVNIADFLAFGFGFGSGIDFVLEVVPYLIWARCVFAYNLSIVIYLFWLIHTMYRKNGKLKIVLRILCVLFAKDLGKIAGFAVANKMGLNFRDFRLQEMLDNYENFDKGEEDWSCWNTFVYFSLPYIIFKVFEEASNNSGTQEELKQEIESQTKMTKNQKKNQKRRNNQDSIRQDLYGSENNSEGNEEPIPIVLENGNNFIPERESKNLNQTRNRRKRKRNQNRKQEAENNVEHHNEPNSFLELQNMPEQMNNRNQGAGGEFFHGNSEENIPGGVEFLNEEENENQNMTQKTCNKFKENQPKQPIIVDELDKILECPICLEEFKTPKMLPCQHSFCMEDCLKNLVDSNSVSKEIICPICRKKCSVPRKGFPNNYTLQSLLELQKRTKSCVVLKLN